MELAGKSVVVTGAAGNIGAACAWEAARAGARVSLFDMPGADVAALAAAIRDDGGTATAHEGDLSVEADVAALIDAARGRYGRLDALINTAAAMALIGHDRDLASMDAAVWDRIMAVNLGGAMLCCKYAVPIMRAQRGGSIVMFGSTAGLLGDVGLVAYATSKAGLMGFTRAVATSYGKDGIRCNIIVPGSVYGDAARARIPADALKLFERTRLTPRLGVPEDVAHMAVYLASDKATYVTGQSFVVDGGGTAHQPWVGAR